MRKLLILGILTCFLASCSGYEPIKQTWVPRKHKPKDFTKPINKKRKN